MKTISTLFVILGLFIIMLGVSLNVTTVMQQIAQILWYLTGIVSMLGGFIIIAILSKK